MSPQLSYLESLEAESIFIIREVVAQFERPVMLYSVGKDSSVLLRLAQKAFAPAKIPFPLVHVDTGYKFPEMYTFRDQRAQELGVDLLVYGNQDAIKKGTNPYEIGTRACCGLLKTQALLDALKLYKVDAAIGGARRDEERSRAKERVFSFRDQFGQWDPKNQRPELWSLYNGKIRQGESIRVFPMSNWTEIDIWFYILKEQLPIVPLYFAQKRKVQVKGDAIFPIVDHPKFPIHDGSIQEIPCRYRSLGCMPCTGAIRSEATTVEQIIDEMIQVRTSERALRVIDHDTDGSMELKKREGYF